MTASSATERPPKTLRSELDWFRYWYIQRRLRHLPMHLAWKLPKKVLYWAVVRAAVMVEPNTDPSGVTAKQMLDKIGDPQ